jgi:hypothetical protein
MCAPGCLFLEQKAAHTCLPLAIKLHQSSLKSPFFQTLLRFAVDLALSMIGPILGVKNGLELNYFYLVAGER